MHKKVSIEKLINYFEEQGKTIFLTTNLFEEGVIDSLEMLDLVEFLEREFDITIEQKYLLIENFSTIEKIIDTILEIK